MKTEDEALLEAIEKWLQQQEKVKLNSEQSKGDRA